MWRLFAFALAFAPAAAHAAHALGLNVHQDAAVGPNATKDAGLTWVRIDLNWDGAQPADGPPDFTVLDATVNAARQKGLSVLATVGYTPGWASSADVDGKVHSNDVPVAGKYEAFVTLAVQHFRDRVTYYELWNEPNLGDFFEGTPQQYIDLILKPGSDAVRAACSTCKVVGPGLSSLIAGKWDVWLDAILKQAADKIDVVNGHNYASFTEDSPSAGVTNDSFLNRLESHRVIKLGGITVYEAPLSFKEVMDANHCTKPFWLTETGVEAALGDSAKLSGQARYHRRVLEKAATRPWWTTTLFYEAFDVPQGMYHFGVVQDAGGGSYTKKPVFDFLQLASQGQAFGGGKPACSDGLDNDGDGLIDYPEDPQCASPSGASEDGTMAADPGMPDGGTPSPAVSDGGGLGRVDGGTPTGGSGCALYGGGAPPQRGLFALLLGAALIGCGRRVRRLRSGS
jgi:hypothetical protein